MFYFELFNLWPENLISIFFFQKVFPILSQVDSEARGAADASAHLQRHRQQFCQDHIPETEITITVPTTYDQDMLLGSDVNKTSIVNKYVNPNIASKQKTSSLATHNDILDSSAPERNCNSGCSTTASISSFNFPARNVNAPNLIQDSHGNYDFKKW